MRESYRDDFNEKCRAIKGAVFVEGMLTGAGFLISNEQNIGNVSFTLDFSGGDEAYASFVFGFTGAGKYYDLKVDCEKKLITLYLVRDGMHVYLQHLRCDILKKVQLIIYYESPSIRVYMQDWCIINVYDTSIKSGQWGFRCLKKSFRLPGMIIKPQVAEKTIPVICIGDGFNNARWPKRDFLSWPELCFGNDFRYRNYCLSASNSNRVLSLVELEFGVLSKMSVGEVFCSFGTDDMIEGESLSVFIGRFEKICELLSDISKKVRILALPTRSTTGSIVDQWNKELESLSLRLGFEFIDTNACIKYNQQEYMTKGDHPNGAGQLALAEAICLHLGAELYSCPICQKESPEIKMGRLTRALLYRTKSYCSNKLGHFDV